MRGNLWRPGGPYAASNAGRSAAVIAAISAVVVGVASAPAAAGPLKPTGRTERATVALAVNDQAATSAVAVAADGAGGSDVVYQVRGGAVVTRNLRDGT